MVKMRHGRPKTRNPISAFHGEESDLLPEGVRDMPSIRNVSKKYQM
jgi:hypothetical protein